MAVDISGKVWQATQLLLSCETQFGDPETRATEVRKWHADKPTPPGSGAAQHLRITPETHPNLSLRSPGHRFDLKPQRNSGPLPVPSTAAESRFPCPPEVALDRRWVASDAELTPPCQRGQSRSGRHGHSDALRTGHQAHVFPQDESSEAFDLRSSVARSS